jgi:GntR family transcriptional regulator/MocR family aminotransferase
MKQPGRSFADLNDWQVVRHSPTPLFRQVYLQIRSAILSQTLKPGTKLPSTRELAAQLSVSRSAVVAAFDQLIAEGYVGGKTGSGTYVAAGLFQSRAVQKAGFRKAKPASLDVFVGDLVDVTARNDSRPFNLGRTLIDARTHSAWRKLTARAFRAIDPVHLGYSDPRGLPALRQAVSDYLRVARGVRCDADQVVITTGTQHAVDLVIRVLKLAGEKVWVEDPGYPLTVRALVAAGAVAHPVPVDEHGIDVRAGIARARSARAVFITPSHQFPTGVVLSMSRRLALLAWARESKSWIVEDDYSSEFRYGGRPLAALQGLDDAERVIYVGTLNKALFPGLRLGYAVVPATLLPAFVRTRYLADRQPSSLHQGITADFMEDGHFAAHIRRMRAVYAGQRDLLVKSLRRRLADYATVEPPDQGMHLVLHLTKGLSDVAIQRAAFGQRVVTRAMSELYLAAPPRSALMLGFSGHPPSSIPSAVARLAEVIEAAAGRGRARTALTAPPSRSVPSEPRPNRA